MRDFRTMRIFAGTMAVLAVWTFSPLPQGVAHGGNLPAISRGGSVPGARPDLPERLRVAQAGKVTPEKLERWRSMSPENKERIRERYRHWKTLSPERRERILEHRRRWGKLPEKEKRYLRQRREVFRNAQPEDRQAIRKFFRGWKHLPPDRRGSLRRNVEKWRDLSVEEREERLKKWPFYRDLSPAERKAVDRFLFSEGLPGPRGGPPGSPRD